MSSNYGQTKRDYIGGSLTINGKQIVDKNANIYGKNAKFKGDTCLNNVQVKGILDLTDADIVGDCNVAMPIFSDNTLPLPNPVAGGPVALITGTSRGNGRWIANKLKTLGYYVIGTTRTTPGGPYDFPRYKPATSPNIDEELQLDISIKTGGAPSVDNFMTTLDSSLFALGDKPLSVIVLNATRASIGSFKGVYNKTNSITPYNFDPFPPDPTTQSRIDEGTRMAGEYQIRLLRELLFRLTTGGLTARIASNCRVIILNSIDAWARQLLITPYHIGAKTFLRTQIDCLRSEIFYIPGESSPYPNLTISQCTPIIVNTGGSDIYPSAPDIGPILGDIELVPISLEWQAQKTALTTTPQIVGDAVAQVLQLPSPPTDFLVVPPSGTLGHDLWINFVKPLWCGDSSSLRLFRPIIYDEFRYQNLNNSIYATFFTNVFKIPTISLMTPSNYDDFDFTEGAGIKIKTLVFSGFLLDGPFMQFSYKVNAGSYVNVATTYAPPNPPFSYIETWTTNAPVNFSAYAGTTITLAVKGITPNAIWTNGVNAANIFTIQIDIPI